MWGLRILEIVMENKGGVTIPRWAFGLAAAVVALLVVLVIVLIPRGKDSNPVAAGSSNNEQSQPASSSTAEPSISALAASSSASTNHRAVCDVKVPTGKEFSADIPSDYTWEQMTDSVHYPVSKIYGPAVRQGRLGQCFAHNPTGAAMSAINAMVVIGNDEIPADARRAIFSSRYDGKPDPWEDEESSDSNDDMSDYVSVIYAYSIQGYSTERATVKVYFMVQKKGKSINIGWVPIRMVWEDGDWRFDSEKSELTTNILMDESDDPSQRFTIGKEKFAEWGFKR
ncbi:hypothetical protein [Rothia sp. HMSC071B01]|uniref:hypothetical protein n=2 Tax=unclassified Rothia (in: high G+C Gram-positive bacteria) TaxID=2689056 RepID=UPI00114CE4DC|nr:hypothetical protein [Rothia sp. HMSC071B01]